MRRSLFVYAVGLIFFALYLVGCSSPVGPASSSPGSVALSTIYSSSPISTMGKTSSVNAIDSIKLSRVRVIFRNIRIKSEENEEVEMNDEHSGDGSSNENSTKKLKPFVLDLNLSGTMQQISLTDVPTGTYNRLKFQIHKVNKNEIDSLSASEQAAFTDFITGGNYSIILNGTVYKNGQATAFTYKSEIDVEIEQNLVPPLTINQSQTNINLTLAVSSAGWFVDKNNNLLDPTDQQNFSVIENNLKSFLKAFKDNNKDGKEDKD